LTPRSDSRSLDLRLGPAIRRSGTCLYGTSTRWLDAASRTHHRLSLSDARSVSEKPELSEVLSCRIDLNCDLLAVGADAVQADLARNDDVEALGRIALKPYVGAAGEFDTAERCTGRAELGGRKVGEKLRPLERCDEILALHAIGTVPHGTAGWQIASHDGVVSAGRTHFGGGEHR
jgi:hypothetical protein